VYSYQAGTVKAYEIGALTVNGTTSTTAEAMTAAVTGTSMATATSLDYLAWGYE
jgi:hypothetical protein